MSEPLMRGSSELRLSKLDSIPFGPADVTAGTENELQAIVIGSRTTVDLPVTIERSKYFANIARRVAHGEASRKLLRDLNQFLNDNPEQVWENSWVRFPRTHLSPMASRLLDQDLASRSQTDRNRFLFGTAWGDWVRVPISYLLKLSLTDVVGRSKSFPKQIVNTALRLFPHFSNDLSSPETSSFYVVDSAREPQFGKGVAREMSIRFLLSHLLVEW